MKLLLVAPRDWYFPVGLSYIAAALKEAGHEVHCCYADSQDDLAALEGGQYDFLCTGGMCVHLAQLETAISAAKQAGVKVVVGGNIVTSEPELMSRALDVDYAVIGQGEETIVELLDCIERNGILDEVAGIGYFSDGDFKMTGPRTPSRPLDDLPWPDYAALGLAARQDAAKPSDQQLLDAFDEPREYWVVAARSCPFQCTFCYHPEGERYRQRSVESVMAELREAVPRDRINIISIQDDLFAQSEERVYDFCRQFKALTATLTWDVKWMCQMRVDSVTPDLLDAMKDAGCYRLGYGFESYSVRVLKSMRKRITPDQIHKAIHATTERSIGIEAHFIFGDPAETLETAAETLAFWKEHVDAGIYLDFIIAYPNSEIYQMAISEGIITDRLAYIRGGLGTPLNLTKMPDKDFRRLQAAVAEATTETKLGRILKRTANTLRIWCPHCRNVSEFRNFEEKTPPIPDVYCRHCRRRIALPVGIHRWQRQGLMPTLLRSMHRMGIHPTHMALGVLRAADAGARHRLLKRPCRAVSDKLRRFLFMGPAEE